MKQPSIERRALDTLRPADYNPRTITEAAMRGLRASIERFGLVQPIIVNTHSGKDVVVGGHQRLKVLLDLGETETDVILVDLPETEEKALNLTLNNPAIAGDFTEGVLPLLDDIQFQLPDVFEALRLGDISALLPELDVGGSQYADADLDEIPESPESVTQPGDLWMLGNHRLVCGDATDADRVAYLMQGRKADMVFTDPPYNVDYGVSKNPRHKIRTIENDKQSPSEWHEFCIGFLRVIKQYCEGDVYTFGAPGPEGMRQRLIAVEMGLHWSATIIWKKNRLVLTPANYQRMYEPCLYGWFGKSSYNGDRTQTEVWEIDPHYCDVIVKRWEDLTGLEAVRQPAVAKVTANA